MRTLCPPEPARGLLRLCAAFLLACACQGELASPVGPGSFGDAAGGTTDPDGAAPEEASVGPAPLRRLGKVELQRTLHALLPGLPADFDMGDLPNDNDIQLAFALPGSVSDVEAKRFMELAESAFAALGDHTPGAQYDCAGRDDATCARAFIESFGKRAYRRPLAQAEVTDLLALFSTLRSDAELSYDVGAALDVLAQAMLQSPGFLYRWERGLATPERDGKLIKFDSYEMASRLSYFLWNSMPDDELLAAADRDELRTPDQLAAQAERMLADAQTDDTFADFVSQWLELGPLAQLLKDEHTYPQFRPELRPEMRDEAEALARSVLRSERPTFNALLTAPYSFVEPELASYYDLTPDSQGRVDLTGTARAGLLTQAALMAVKGNSYRTSPVRRGKFIINRLLCTVVPPPPKNVVTELPPPDPNLTLREQMAEHRKNPACASCHEQMDAIGFAFEHFDGAGRYRERDGTQAIDTRGTLMLDGQNVSFADARDLATKLAASPTAHGCFARQWLRYAIDRFEQSSDAAAVSHLQTAYEASGLDTRKLLVEITRTLPFSHRAPSEGEVVAP